MATTWGFGIAAAVPVEVVRQAAIQAEALGYAAFWVNDTPNGDGLAALAEAAAVTTRINLGVGVVPLSRRSPESIINQVRETGLPLDRLLLGVGSGAGTGAITRVRAGVEALKAELDTRVYIAALGPKMCRLAGEVADGVLFNWLTPDYARRSAAWVQEGAHDAGRATPTLAAYVRAALGDAGAARLSKEAANYSAVPAYNAHFDRMGVPAVDTAISAAAPGELQAALRAWDGVLDEVVVRAITPNDTVDETLTLLRAAAPQG